MDYAPEYTPELSKSFLNSQLTGIDDMGRVDEGRATAEQAARGTLGQQTDDSAIGAVRAGVRRDKANTISAFNMDVANKTREERLGALGRGYQVEDRNFGAAEAQKTRDFQKQMAEMGYWFQDDQRQKESEFNPGGFLAGVAGTAVSAYTGNYLGAAAGAKSALDSKSTVKV